MSCLTFQSVTVYNKFKEVRQSYLSQNKWENSDLSKGLFIHDDHSIGRCGCS